MLLRLLNLSLLHSWLTDLLTYLLYLSTRTLLKFNVTDLGLQNFSNGPTRLLPTRPLLYHVRCQACLGYRRHRRVMLTWTRTLMVIRSTDQPVVLKKKGSNLIWTTTSLLQKPTRLFAKSSHMKLYVGSDPLWVGLIHRTWMTPLVQARTRSQHLNSNHWER